MISIKHPVISIITATYNRCRVLKYAILSVLQQSIQSWELLVIDDVSSDGTADLVRSFSDPRIRFIQLPVNYGEQSGPNNAGLSQAQGEYIAYLNQDDLWFPDHLEKLLNKLESTYADWVFSPAVRSNSPGQYEIACLGTDGCYNPLQKDYVEASSWLVKKEVLITLGGWRPAMTLRIPSSQDLLIRAWKMKFQIIMDDHITAIILPSGYRKDSYINQDESENKLFYENLANADFWRAIYAKILLKPQKKWGVFNIHTIYHFPKRFGYYILSLFGIMPLHLNFFFRYCKKGAFIKHLRNVRGLPPRQ